MNDQIHFRFYQSYKRLQSFLSFQFAKMYPNDRISEIDIIYNKNYVDDLNYTMNYTRFFFSLLGIRPMVSTSASKIETHFSKLLMIIIFFLMGFITIPCILHIVFREKDPITKLMLIGPVSFCVASTLKYSAMIYRHGVIKDCIEHLEIDWKKVAKENERKIMTRNVKVGRDLTILCAGFMYSCTLSYHLLMPIFTGIIVNEFNETVRVLLYPGYDIFVDEQKSPMYELIMYMCCLAACIDSTIAITCCNFAAILVTHACGQFQIVMSRLETLFDSVDENEKESLQQKICDIVRTHVRVLGFSSKIEDVFREICCIEVVASTLIICLDEYYCMTEWKNSETLPILTYIGVLISLSFNIFIFCYIGELLKQQGDSIVKAAYMSEWHNLRGKNGLAIVMIMTTGHYPRKIRAGRMTELSISTFGSIMKNTLAYLNILRTVGY